MSGALSKSAAEHSETSQAIAEHDRVADVATGDIIKDARIVGFIIAAELALKTGDQPSLVARIHLAQCFPRSVFSMRSMLLV